MVTFRLGPKTSRFPLPLTAISTDQSILDDLAHQLAWVGSAISVSPQNGQVAYDIPVALRPTSATEQIIEISYQHKKLSPDDQACWLPLSSGAAIASGSPVPAHRDDAGLGIPLAMLAAIGSVSHATEYKGGLVTKGFSILFVASFQSPASTLFLEYSTGAGYASSVGLTTSEPTYNSRQNSLPLPQTFFR